MLAAPNPVNQRRKDIWHAGEDIYTREERYMQDRKDISRRVNEDIFRRKKGYIPERKGYKHEGKGKGRRGKGYKQERKGYIQEMK